jgi:hypothetical protein
MVVDWPVGAVPLTLNDIGRMGGGLLIYRLPSGALLFRRPRSGVAEVVEPADWDRGYRVAGQDGRYPTWWPTAEGAKQAAALRQRLRSLPRHGSHWIAKGTSGHPYGIAKVTGSFAEHFGYARGSGHGNRWMLAHRVSFIVFHGRLPAGTVEHYCKRKRCANPDCLGEATRAENEARELPGAAYGVARRDRRREDMSAAMAALRDRFGHEWARR